LTPLRVSRASQDRRRSWLWQALAALALVALGIGIGSRIAAPRGSNPAAVTTTVAQAEVPAKPTRATRSTRTQSGAVAAAASAVELLDGPALLDSARIRRLVNRIAASSARTSLARAYAQGAVEVRTRLAVDSVPAPVVILRSALAGYRVESYTRAAATVAIWRVGIVGSGASVQPQQSWRTETVSLVWEHGWKVTSFASAPGPTPPLPQTADATTIGDLFAEIPRFTAFSHAEP
jgi:hypothetical protein